jgi:AspT/YidE/YbjL antiporter-like protein
MRPEQELRREIRHVSRVRSAVVFDARDRAVEEPVSLRARQDRRRTQPRRPLRRRRHARYPRRPRDVRDARLRLQFGDQIQIVGVPDDLDKAAAAVGNSLKELNETHFIPFFLGITLGVALGTLPIAFPGLPQPIKLGLAGGPLIVALILGPLGRIGRQVWHMPVNTNLAFREFGIALSFAAVGLGAGAKFFATVFSATGLQWLFAGACVTVLPLMLIGISRAPS